MLEKIIIVDEIFNALHNQNKGMGFCQNRLSYICSPLNILVMKVGIMKSNISQTNNFINNVALFVASK